MTLIELSSLVSSHVANDRSKPKQPDRHTEMNAEAPRRIPIEGIQYRESSQDA